METHLAAAEAKLHGWRAFAGEVGIIVVGVLIALGAQEVVSVGPVATLTAFLALQCD